MKFQTGNASMRTLSCSGIACRRGPCSQLHIHLVRKHLPLSFYLLLAKSYYGFNLSYIGSSPSGFGLIQIILYVRLKQLILANDEN